MRARDFLLEYNRAKTIQALGGKLMARYRGDDGHPVAGWEPEDSWEPEDESMVLDYLEQQDPTAKKAFVLDLARWYLDGSMKRLEDAPKAALPLSLYGKFRNRGLPALKSLSFSQLLDLGDELGEMHSRSDAGRAEEQGWFDRESAYLATNNDAYKVIVPFTEEASKFFGRGTRWCTAANENNMFSHYCRDIRAPDQQLWIVIFKGQTGKKWQLHLKTGQFMNARDEELSQEDWFAEEDFVLWFANKVMRAYMPSLWKKLLKYYPDPDSLAPALKDKIMAEAGPYFIQYFAQPTDNMIHEMIECHDERRVRDAIEKVSDDVGGRIQIAGLRSYGLWFCDPRVIKASIFDEYCNMVKERFASATAIKAQAWGYNLPLVTQFALHHNLAGPFAKEAREGVADSGTELVYSI